MSGYVKVFMLCCFVSFSNAWGQLKPCDCPGDVNGDGLVDLKDVKIVSENWLQPCLDEVPVLIPKTDGTTEEQAFALADILNVDPKNLVTDNGKVFFVEPQQFLKLPSFEIQDQQIIDLLTRDSEDAETQELSFEGLDFGAIKDLNPVDPRQATSSFSNALQQVELLPSLGTPEPTHTMFKVFDLDGKPILEQPVDTRINFMQSFNGIPISGPGAKVSATFAPDSGEISHLLVANRQLDEGPKVKIISPTEAAIRCAESNPGIKAQYNPQLMYYAPALSEKKVNAMIPCYECNGKIMSDSGELSDILSTMIPATEDRQYVPQISLSAGTEGSTVFAGVQVSGGASPLSYSWISSSTDLSDETGSSLSYDVLTREGGLVEENIKVVVTDGNGISVAAVKTLIIDSLKGLEKQNIGTLSIGRVDYGIERAVSDLGGPEQSGYKNVMSANGIARQFNWTGASSWERDFKDTDEVATGLDHNYTDDVDQTLYIGHGSPSGFTFESSQDDGALRYWEVEDSWGDRDCEWMCILSCQVLKEDASGGKWWERWGPAFNGLHLLLGYDTNARANTDTTRVFAEYQMGRQFFFITLNPVPVRSAWFLAKAEEQPSDRVAVAMGVVGPGGAISNYNDYFWGRGPTGPDIRRNNIQAYWAVFYK